MPLTNGDIHKIKLYTVEKYQSGSILPKYRRSALPISSPISASFLRLQDGKLNGRNVVLAFVAVIITTGSRQARHCIERAKWHGIVAFDKLMP